MAHGKTIREGYVVVRPNRHKASSKATRSIVFLLLIASAALMLIVTVGGWSKLEGAKPVDLFYIAVYVGMAYLVMRWNRGVLPLAAALAIILGIFAAVAGPSWFDRDKSGFSKPELLFGGSGLDESILGLITLLVIPVQLLLIAFSMRAFAQAWNVEIDVPAEEADKYGGAEPDAQGAAA